MDASDVQKRSEEARTQGNAAYKSGDIGKAIEWYQKANELDPQASSPLGNLAAATFELGDYATSIDYAQRALSLLSDDEANHTSRNRLVVRKFRAHLLLKQYDTARSLASSHDALSQERQKLAGLVPQDDRSKAQKSAHIFPFKPYFGKALHYEVVSGDKPASLFDTGLLSLERRELSFLFADFGDARHLFATLMHIADPAISKPADLKLRLTLADVNPVNLARFLVVLSMLEELAADNAPITSSIPLAVLFHTYITPIMPDDLYEELQRHISLVTNALQGNGALPLSVTVANPQSVLRILHFWQQHAQQKFSTTWVRGILTEERIDMFNPDINWYPDGVRKEAKLFRKTCVVRSSLSEGRAQDMVARLADLKPDKLEIELDEVKEHWRSNVTLLSDGQYSWGGLTFSPFVFGSRVATKEISATAIFADIVSEWLLKVCKAVKTLRDCIQIVILDSNAVLQTLSSQPSGNRRLYDRIHLSHLPDLMGGTLYVYTFATEHLHPAQTSYVTWKCLLYSEVFTSWAEYDTEFLGLIPDKAGLATAERLFLVRPDADVHEQDAGSGLFTSEGISGFRRARPLTLTKLPYQQLMPRPQLTTWLQRILLKLALPHIDRDVPTPEVLSPLNLSIFVRLLARLHSIGYPAHWLSDILDAVLSGIIRTSARQPGSNPLKLKEIRASLAERDIDTSFLSLELQTLLGMMGSDLGFGTLYSAPASVQCFHITFNTVALRKEDWVTYLLVIDKTSDGSSGTELSLSKQRQAQLAKVKVISTFNWNRTTKVARFYMSSDTMESLVKEGYHITLWHTESWSAQSERRALTDCTVTNDSGNATSGQYFDCCTCFS